MNISGEAIMRLSCGLNLKLKNVYYVLSCNQNLISTLDLENDNSNQIKSFLQSNSEYYVMTSHDEEIKVG